MVIAAGMKDPGKTDKVLVTSLKLANIISKSVNRLSVHNGREPLLPK